ncbi:MAG TPA: hypothetical protein VFW98_02745 [Gemmatimonadaceae bacterium]|nr:hypothetical protein [Gemmatimonadaceae bacterium]
MDDMGVVWTVHTVLRRNVVLDIDRSDRREFQASWLVFESRAGRKRMAAYPSDWARFTEAELRVLAERAIPWV